MAGVIGVPKIIVANPTLNQKTVFLNWNPPMFDQGVFDALVHNVSILSFAILDYAKVIAMRLNQPSYRFSAEPNA